MGSQSVIHVTNANFQAEVINSELPVLVDFWAPWCGPCKMLGPVIEQLAVEYSGKAKIAKVDIEADEATKQLAVSFGVTGIPALMVFKGGNKVAQTMGMQPKSALAKLIDQSLV